MIGIGASAGGPSALAKVLAPLPADLPAAVVIVQHVDAPFVAGLANWLGSQTALRVRPAREGDRPEAGTALAYMLGLGDGSGLKNGQTVTASDGKTTYSYQLETGSFNLATAAALAADNVNDVKYDGSIGMDTQIDQLHLTPDQLAVYQSKGIIPGTPPADSGTLKTLMVIEIRV